jgi:hypothetical protein
MWNFFEPELRAGLSDLDRDADIGQQVRAALVELLPAGQATIALVCQFCGKLIDSDDPRYTKEMLVAWKAVAKERARSLLEIPHRPEGIDEPILILPTTDPAVSWLSFSSRAIPFVGREPERVRLRDFIHSDTKVSWMLVMGAAGSGKSRLALELCHSLRPGWNAGFLSQADAFTGWSHYGPSRPTLIVIDYVSGRAAEASAQSF